MNNTKDTRYKSAYFVETFNDYLDVLLSIQNIEKSELWYRGHNNENWKLLPNIMRYAYEVETAYGHPIKPRELTYPHGQKVVYPNIRAELDILKEYEEHFPYKITNDIELISMAQHHGLLTPFLDWTLDPLVGLFFAINGYDEDKMQEDAAIYVLVPNRAIKYSSICTLTEVPHSQDFTKELIERLLYCDGNHTFVPISVPQMGFRICRQSGKFTWQGYNFTPIDGWGTSNEYIYKIIIPKHAVPEFKSILSILNLNENSVYGDDCLMDNVNKQIREQQIQLFEDDIANIKKKFEELK